MSDYPPPSSALMVWSTVGKLHVRIPHATDPHGPCHVIEIPFTFEGFQLLYRILRDRAQAPSQRIGNLGAPSQAQALWEYIRQGGRTERPQVSAADEAAKAEQARLKAEAARERAERERQAAKAASLSPQDLLDFLSE